LPSTPCILPCLKPPVDTSSQGCCRGVARSTLFTFDWFRVFLRILFFFFGGFLVRELWVVIPPCLFPPDDLAPRVNTSASLGLPAFCLFLSRTAFRIPPLASGLQRFPNCFTPPPLALFFNCPPSFSSFLTLTPRNSQSSDVLLGVDCPLRTTTFFLFLYSILSSFQGRDTKGSFSSVVRCRRRFLFLLLKDEPQMIWQIGVVEGTCVSLLHVLPPRISPPI